MTDLSMAPGDPRLVALMAEAQRRALAAPPRPPVVAVELPAGLTLAEVVHTWRQLRAWLSNPQTLPLLVAASNLMGAGPGALDMSAMLSLLGHLRQLAPLAWPAGMSSGTVDAARAAWRRLEEMH